MMAVHVSIGRMEQVRFVWCSTATDLISYSESFRWGSRCRHRATQTWCMRYPGYLHRAVSNARTTLWEGGWGGEGRDDPLCDHHRAVIRPWHRLNTTVASRTLVPRLSHASLMLLSCSTNASPTLYQRFSHVRRRPLDANHSGKGRSNTPINQARGEGISIFIPFQSRCVSTVSRTVAHREYRARIPSLNNQHLDLQQRTPDTQDERDHRGVSEILRGDSCIRGTAWVDVSP